MQVHTDSKGKVAPVDITQWANRNGCTKCHGSSRFHLMAHYVLVEDEFFTGNYIL